MRKITLTVFLLIATSTSFGQLAVSKQVGKNSNNSKIGYGTFAYTDIPLNEEQNSSLRIELLDFAYYPPVDENKYSIVGYLSIKLGYKKIFSDTKTGVYVEPQAGYCRVVPYQYGVIDNGNDYGDGVAAAIEAGYSFEVGQLGQTINLGLKYESDMGAKHINVNSISLRLSYSFNWIGRKNYQ